MKRWLIPALVAALFVSAAFAVQERVSKQKPKDLGGILTEAKSAFDEARYGASLANLRDALAIVGKERRKAVIAAFPNAPAGWTFVPEEVNEEAAVALAGMAFLGGSSIGGEYRASEGRGRIQVKILADSPLTQMFSMWIANPAMLDKNAELVKYGAHTAVLRTRTKGESYEMQLLVGKDLVQVDATGVSDEMLLKVWNQAAVDAVAGALSK